ncbi:MAG: alpha/beta hydrolase family protein, partial [Candidatus Tectimicrobiota bacterium]
MRRLAFLTMVALVGLAVWLAAQSAWLLAWAMVHDLARPSSRPLTPWLGWSPEASVVGVPHPSGTTRALLVRPRGGRPSAGVVLVHGMVATGEEDWRLQRLAETVAAGGFTVLVPAVPGLKRGLLVEEDIEVVAAVVAHLRAQVEGVDATRVGVVGLSVGGGPALAAAARPASRVAFAGAFGGYYDLVAVLQGLVEAGRAVESELVTTDRWAFFAANGHLAADLEDRTLLLRLAALPPAERGGQMAALAGRLSPAGRALLELLTTDEPERIEALFERAGPTVVHLRRALSPRYYAERLTMKVLLAHGRPDPVVPHTETLRLAAAVPARAEPTVAILPLFTHVD